MKKEKLLEQLAHMFKCYEYNFINVDWKPPEEGVQAYQEIVALIKKPQVTEEFIEKWGKFFGDRMPSLEEDYPIILKLANDKVKQMLKEAGHKVVKPVTEEWIEEKAREFIVKVNVAIQTPEAYKLQLKICKDFIRSLVEEVSSG